MKAKFLVLLGSALLSAQLFSQDPNFHIYLCFGQSNMEGQGAIETQDLSVDERFKVLQALDCSNLNRDKASWYTAVPPTCQCYSGLSPAAYFGKTMVANLPDSITIGVINVAVGGCDIRLFDKDIYEDYDSTYTDSWFTDKIEAYEGNPYAYLINLAKIAQQDGVVKGILLHQGETNTGDSQWPSYVKKIYHDMLADLSLDTVPILAGEVLYESYGSCCGSMNSIIAKLPDTIPTAHVISAQGCTNKDYAHFDSEGYRKLGRRYAVKMLSLMGYEAIYSEAECGTVGDSCLVLTDNKASNASYVTSATANDNITEAPDDDTRAMQMSFTAGSDTSYYLYGRFNNPTSDNDSYWVKMDDGEYELIDDLITTGWQWKEINSYYLSAGEHTLSIAFGENGGYIDKLVIKNTQSPPVDVGEEANNICEPDILSVGLEFYDSDETYLLGQNFPNPARGETSISFEIPKSSYVSLKVFSFDGLEIAELAGKDFISGKHILDFNLEDLPAGYYYYSINTGNFSASRNMIVLPR